MFNNRMLAVAAVLVMAVPALGAATPIVVPPVPEQLVEGHTVFTVIEIAAVTQTNEVRFAAAVAVLVREYQAERRAQRFPGVLWFNDQYLTNPYQNQNADESFRYPCGGAVMAVNAGDPDPRVVIADVRVRSTTILDPTGGSTTLPGVGPVVAGDDTHTYTSPPWVKPYPGTYTYQNDPALTGGHDYAWIGADVGPSTVDASDPANNLGADSAYTVWSDTVVGTVDSSLGLGAFPWDYRESYLITDPNDHSWIIDVYDFYTRYGAEGAPSADTNHAATPPAPTVTGAVTDTDVGEEVWNGMGVSTNGVDPYNGFYTWPVWVVNTLGSPVFVPDYGTGLENCLPFKDLIESVAAPLNGALCGANVPNFLGDGEGNDTEMTVNPYNGAPPWTDDPCMGYQEPSRNGYCYAGQEDIGVGCPHGDPGNACHVHPTNAAYRDSACTINNNPLRMYNALLYFHLEDLRVWDGTTKDHCNYDPALEVSPGVFGGCNPANNFDTNGCSEEQYPWGPNPPQAANDWPCPSTSPDPTPFCPNSATGNVDDCEGNSHPFHPLAPPHEEAEPCAPAFYGPNPSNHGGSTYVNDPNTPWYTGDDGNEWYQITAPCDYAHTTRNIDIYFSPAGRPFPPPVRFFSVLDLEGSSAPFQDFHSSYPGVP